ncbi:hypothetical protein [Methanolobus halotolerans]|uniref:hypothetical protein n=1 Tax=Methanolobus halotolerans TaxID=2052935 RepID=UPI002E2573E2
MKEEAAAELIQHAADELRHTDMKSDAASSSNLSSLSMSSKLIDINSNNDRRKNYE